jgi:hypothetical protein
MDHRPNHAAHSRLCARRDFANDDCYAAECSLRTTLAYFIALPRTTNASGRDQ